MRKVKDLFRNFREATILLIFIVFCIIMTFSSPYFLTWSNLSSTIVGMCCNALLAIGMTVVLASGGIDLSVGSTMAMSGAVTGVLAIKCDVNIWIAAALGILAALCIGLVNGIICSKTNIAPMICTLGTMSIGAGRALVLTTGTSISMMSVPSSYSVLGKGTIGSIPIIIIIALVFAVVFGFLLRKSSVMRRAYYVGSNEQAADFSGINIFRVKMGVYILSGVLAGIAGIITTSRFAVASPTAGDGAEMTAISAAVIGGASVTGGSGTILGTMLGLLLLTFINNALVLLNVDVYWQEFINGCILLVAVLIDYFSRRKN